MRFFKISFYRPQTKLREGSLMFSEVFVCPKGSLGVPSLAGEGVPSLAGGAVLSRGCHP